MPPEAARTTKGGGVGKRHPASFPLCGVHPGASGTPHGSWLVLPTVVTQMITLASLLYSPTDVWRITASLQSNLHIFLAGPVSGGTYIKIV